MKFDLPSLSCDELTVYSVENKYKKIEMHPLSDCPMFSSSLLLPCFLSWYLPPSICPVCPCLSVCLSVCDMAYVVFVLNWKYSLPSCASQLPWPFM